MSCAWLLCSERSVPSFRVMGPWIVLGMPPSPERGLAVGKAENFCDSGTMRDWGDLKSYRSCDLFFCSLSSLEFWRLGVALS